MKVTLYMATSLNGMIARENDNVDFVSKASWASYRAMVEKIKNVIVGQKTYELMKTAGDLEGLTDIQVVVVTDQENLNVETPVFVAHSPAEALSILEGKGFTEALVAGGGTLNGSYLEAGLIDEIFIDVEPVVFGGGIKLFGEGKFDQKLKLLESKQLAPNELQLHYQVLK